MGDLSTTKVPPCSLWACRPLGVYVGLAFKALKAAGDTPKGERMAYRKHAHKSDVTINVVKGHRQAELMPCFGEQNQSMCNMQLGIQSQT